MSGNPSFMAMNFVCKSGIFVERDQFEYAHNQKPFSFNPQHGYRQEIIGEAFGKSSFSAEEEQRRRFYLEIKHSGKIGYQPA